MGYQRPSVSDDPVAQSWRAPSTLAHAPSETAGLSGAPALAEIGRVEVGRELADRGKSRS